MKKTYLYTFMIMVSTLSLQARNILIYQGGVVTTAEVGTDEIAVNGDALTLSGVTFPTAAIDSIVFNKEGHRTDSIVINYQGAKAFVYLPIELANNVEANVNGANVIIDATKHDEQALQNAWPELKYTLSGTTANGSFDMEGCYKSTLYLNGLNLTSTEGGAINIRNGKRIDVYVCNGTVNSLTDAKLASSDLDQQKACFRIKGHAEFKGGGTLNIAGNTTHAYKSNEYTILKKSFTGTINITSAVKDGMHVGQFFEMNNGNVNIQGIGADGIQTEITTTPTDSLNGQAFVRGGNIKIISRGDEAVGIKVDSLFSIEGGNIDITMYGKNSDGITALHGEINDKCSRPNIKIIQNGDYLDYLDASDGTKKKKKSSCYKATNGYFRAGTINVYNNGEKSKGIVLEGDLWYDPFKFEWNLTPDVAGDITQL